MKLAIASLRLLAILWLALGVERVVGAANSGAVNSSTGATQTAYLEFQEFDFSLMNLGLSIDTQSAPFKKEPDFQQRKVFRGLFHFGGKVKLLPFVWDNTKGKLYLDLNFNGDLTDDAAGVFSCRSGNFRDNSQTFTNVLLDFNVPAGLHQFRVDLHLNNFRNGANASAGLKSLWVGKLTLAGQDWQLGLAENLFSHSDSGDPAYLLLRPWKERDQKFSLQDGSLDSFAFARTLSFQNQTYKLNCAYDATAARPRYKVEFKEQQPKLGEVKFTGKFVQRMILEGPNSAVVLDSPSPVLKVPVGHYHQVQAALKQGEVKAYRNFSRSPLSVDISENKPSMLAAGGPLTNSVTTQRRGKQLTLSYQLVGMNGVPYQLVRQGPSEPPLFAIYQGDKKIHSGKFEFG